MNKVHYSYVSFINSTKEGCLAKINNEIVIIKKVKTFNWNAIVVYSPCNRPWIKVAKLSLVEPIEFYT